MPNKHIPDVPSPPLSSDSSLVLDAPLKYRQTQAAACLGSLCLTVSFALFLISFGQKHCPPPSGCTAHQLPESFIILLGFGSTVVLIVFIWGLIGAEGAFAYRRACPWLGGVFGIMMYMVFHLVSGVEQSVPGGIGLVICCFWSGFCLELWVGGGQRVIEELTVSG
ncbi:uncharacterized protein BCR38DRAFT_484200 [Pseudomassariella vexata]|uniref:Uncharacterized protein n=1 Tax=Pseudomassariella vexata TaxID=1141098 RepID=A0A1Y2E4Z5_9PEZI|nr:uncharacterized protein BCR38DRAFT_484200 [Pseudomassariella vexata]ORY66582.1 hypothetical protein BCR38DRAFT_484200 [Pseudomassariella vexata]